MLDLASDFALWASVITPLCPSPSLSLPSSSPPPSSPASTPLIPRVGRARPSARARARPWARTARGTLSRIRREAAPGGPRPDAPPLAQCPRFQTQTLCTPPGWWSQGQSTAPDGACR
eukprot:359531-Chlamydomonas_euryale.AAC.1